MTNVTKDRKGRNCENVIFEFLNLNKDKRFSIYDLYKEFDKNEKEIKYTYHAVYNAIKLLEAKEKINLSKDTEGIRNKFIITINN